MRTSDQFAENPIAVFVDPSKMVAARAQEASVEELHRELLPKEPVDIRIPPDSVPRLGARGQPFG